MVRTGSQRLRKACNRRFHVDTAIRLPVLQKDCYKELDESHANSSSLLLTIKLLRIKQMCAFSVQQRPWIELQQ
jgi:hypothetical protein